MVLAGCVDGTDAPDNLTNPVFGPQLAIQPAFSLVGPGGQEVRSVAQRDALSEAFDLVDRFRFVVRRASTNVIVVDTVVTVTPGSDEYDFSFGVAAGPNERFKVTLTAFQGETELFEADEITVQATPAAAGGGESAPTTNIAMQYSGPGATATSIQVTPTLVVLGPGGSTSLTSAVQDAEGNALTSVPVAWASSNTGVATAAGGTVSGVADGIAEVSVSTPTGLEATASVYVVGGRLAYVAGGVVMARDAAGGEATTRGGDGGASGPAWSPDGSRLFYSEGGSVRRAGVGEPIVNGTWPSVSPNGRYIATQDGGAVRFGNDDGSASASGPEGTAPVWVSGDELLVGGGSVHRVSADGSGRTEVAGGSAGLPAVGPGGEIAYTDGSSLRVSGRGEVAGDAAGRASFSPNGRWLVYPGGSGLMVVPAAGGPSAALPGLGSATDPAFQPSNPLSGDPGLSLTGFDPDPPVPGQTVHILGSGFDRIIPSNNRIIWPTRDGSEETRGTSANSSSVTTRMPRSLAAGQVRVETRGSSALLDFVPSLGAIEVHAAVADGTPTPGVVARVTNASGAAVGSETTDDSGNAIIPGLTPGRYTLIVTAPDGFAIVGPKTFVLDITTDARLVELLLRPQVRRIEVDPTDPVVAVGGTISMTVSAFDINDNPVTTFDRAFWGAGTRHVGVGGSGLTGTVGGVFPTTNAGDAIIVLALNDLVFELNATVTSHISGKVTESSTDESGTTTVAVRGASVRITGPDTDKSTSTDGVGDYRFDGLLGGTYTVAVTPPEGGEPLTRTVTIGESSPTGVANFSLGALRTGPIRIAGVGCNCGNQATNDVISGSHVDGSIARISESTFNAMTVADLIANYEVLIITWASSSSLNVDWETRLRPYLEAGGGILFEDPNNTGDLSAIMTTSGACSGTGSHQIIKAVPGLTDGLVGSLPTPLGLANNHFCLSSWSSWLSPFMETSGGSYTTGLYGQWGAGRIVITGPDQDYHSHPSDGGQWELLINTLKWAGRLIG